MAETCEGDGDVDAGGALAHAALAARDGENALDAGEGGWEGRWGERARFDGRRRRAVGARERDAGEGWETSRGAGHGDGEARSDASGRRERSLLVCYHNRKVWMLMASNEPWYVSLVPRAPSYLTRVG